MMRFFIICMRICGETAGSFNYSGYSVMPNSVMAGFDCNVTTHMSLSAFQPYGNICRQRDGAGESGTIDLHFFSAEVHKIK